MNTILQAGDRRNIVTVPLFVANLLPVFRSMYMIKIEN